VAKNDELALQVKDDFTQAELSSRERAIADFTVKVTCSPNACSPMDLERLRSEGLSDDDLLSLSQIIAFQNMSTRLFESLATIE
jgi:uncharacterized peroxidase-related enzyme